MATPDYDLYAAAVGRNEGFYLPYFRRVEERGYAPVSWNWATFCFGLFWFVYRRQYRWAAGLALAAILVGVLVQQVAIAGYAGFGTVLQLAFLIGVNGVYLPLNANGIYYRSVKERVERVQSRFAADRKRQIEVLMLRGGPNPIAPVLVLGVVVLMLSLGSADIPQQ